MTYAPVTPSSAKKNNLPVSQEAGLKEKDIITKVGNIEVGRAGSISTLIGEYQVGDKVEITYRRGDETKTTIVTLAGYAD